MVYTILTYILDLILGLDTDCIGKNADEIMDIRLEYSQHLLDEFFSIIDNIVNDNTLLSIKLLMKCKMLSPIFVVRVFVISKL